MEQASLFLIVYRHKKIQIEKFVRDFSFSSVSSLSISAFYMQVPFKVVVYIKERAIFPDNAVRMCGMLLFKLQAIFLQ